MAEEINTTQTFNVGESNYAQHKIQPWDIWKYHRNPWVCDMIKRFLRRKGKTESDIERNRESDFKKIKHILEYMMEETSRDLSSPVVASTSGIGMPKEMYQQIIEDYQLNPNETSFLYWLLGTPKYTVDSLQLGWSLLLLVELKEMEVGNGVQNAPENKE